MARRIRPFDDSQQKDRRRSTTNPSTNTSAIDPYRQGVELSKPSDFANGIAKIHDGYNDQTGLHGVPQLVLGQERPILRDDNSFLEGAKFDPLSLFDRFTFGVPQIDIIDPSVGLTTGGTFVSITGSNFFQTILQVSGSNVTFTYHDDRHITFTTVASTAGPVDVTVLGPGGSDTAVGGFTYTAGSVSVSSLSYTTQGDTLGGEFFAINGSGFTGATAVKIDGVDVRAYVVSDDTTILAIAPAGTAGTKDITVTGPSGTGTGVGLWEYWDPSVEASCNTLVERNAYSEEVTNGLKWTARVGTSVFEQYDGTDGLYTPLDDQAKEPRCIAAQSRTLHDNTNTLPYNFDSVGGDMSVGTFAIGYRTPDAGAAGGEAYQDPVPLLHQQTGGTVWATGHSDDGFGVAGYDGVAWSTVRAACGVDQLNVGIGRWDATVIEARANGGAWTTDNTFSGVQNAAFNSYLGADYAGAVYSNVNVRFMMMANTLWDNTLCGKLDTWVKNRHGGKNDIGGGPVEIWYVTSDVLPTSTGGLTPAKQITIKGKGFTGITTVQIAVGSAIEACTSVSVVDDNTITCVPPAYDVTGVGTLIVTGASTFGQMVDAVEYYNVFSRAAEQRIRIGHDATRTDDGTYVQAVTNSGTADGGTRDFAGNGTAGYVFSTSEDPQLFIADAAFGGEDVAGADDATGRAFVTPVYNTSITGPVTTYTVMRTELGADIYIINRTGSSADAFSGYGTTGSNAWTVSNGVSAISVTMPDATPSIFAAAFDGASSWATVNNWLQAESGDTSGGTGQESGLGFGDYGVASGVPWKMATRIVVSGKDGFTTRRKMMRALENFYQIAASAA